MQRVEHIGLEEELIADVETVERYTFDERDMPNESCLPVIHIAAVADSKRMVDRKM